MAITSFYFLCFAAVLFAVYYLLPGKLQGPFLLLASIGYFLTAGSAYLILYPAVTITIIYGAALYIDRVKEQKKRKTVLSLVVVFCLLELTALKYCNFGIYTYNAIAMRLFPGSSLLKTVQAAAPLGISFYTLSLLGYLFDVYYEIGKPQKNFLKFALFGFYFPVIISGPILRYRDVEQELYAPHEFDYHKFTYGLQRMLWGFFKKLVIAERLAVVVNTIYGDTDTYRGFYIVIAAIGFAFQLYADFSGGMDIVIGLSEALGISLAENFDRPFFSKSIQEFWRRWHITLGAWLKDYLFYPLLRSKAFTKLQADCKKKFGKKWGKKLATFAAMFILWFAVGMWHGGAWKFIMGSGLIHWAYIVLGEAGEPLWKKLKAWCRVTDNTKWFALLQQIRTFLLVSASFVFFRASSFTDGLHSYRQMFADFNPEIFWNGSLLSLGLNGIELVITVVVLIGILRSRLQCCGIYLQRLLRRQGNVKKTGFQIHIVLSSVCMHADTSHVYDAYKRCDKGHLYRLLCGAGRHNRCGDDRLQPRVSLSFGPPDVGGERFYGISSGKQCAAPESSHSSGGGGIKDPVSGAVYF